MLINNILNVNLWVNFTFQAISVQTDLTSLQIKDCVQNAEPCPDR